MKTKILLCTVAILLVLSVDAQPRLTITKNIIDCGTILFKKPVTAQFELRNRSLHQLNIDKVEVSCGCTTVDYPQKSISLGQRFTVTATFDAQMLGHFNKQVALFFHGVDKPVILTMKGIVSSAVVDYSGTYPFQIGDLRVDKNDIEFDNVNRGDRPEAVLQIMNTSRHLYKPVVMHLPAYLTAKAVPVAISPKQSGKVILTLDSRKLRDYGLTQTMVYLSRYEGDKVGEENSINISAVLLPDFKSLTSAQMTNAPVMSLSANVIDLGSFGGKSKKSGFLEITNRGVNDLDISSLQVFTSGLNVMLGKRVLKTGETTKLKVTAVAKVLKDARSKPRVLMITNDPSKSKVIIDINVTE